MTPGAYLRQARESAGLELEDLALRLDTDPPVSARRRAEWLAVIERDVAPVPLGLALALQALPELRLHFALRELDRLTAAQQDAVVWRAAAEPYRYPVLSAEEAERQAEQRSAAA